MDNTDYIYNYTSLNVLAEILANRTLRLNSLANVDDMLEAETHDFDGLVNYVFVSSWSNDSKENIALWNLYTPKMTGIRIGFPKDFLELVFNQDGFVTNIKKTAKNYYVISPSEQIPINVKYKKEDKVPFTLVELDKSKNDLKMTRNGSITYQNWVLVNLKYGLFRMKHGLSYLLFLKNMLKQKLILK